MKKRTGALKILSITVFFMLMNISAGDLLAFGQQDPEYPGGTITVTGRVRLVGTALLPRMVISDAEDHDWYVENADRELLASMEQRQVTVQGKAEYQDIILANGEKAGVRRFLRNIKILSEPRP